MFQLRVGRCGGARSGDGDEMTWCFDSGLVVPEDLAQTPAHPISGHRIADPARSNKSGAQPVFRQQEEANGKKLSPNDLPFFADALELPGFLQAATGGESLSGHA